jgi:peptide deformylase
MESTKPTPRPIVRYGADILEKKAVSVENVTGREVAIVRDMVETMYAASGVGLAAPQIGVGERIMVTDASGGEKADGLIVLINPEIVASEGEQFEEEGCLSIPGFSEVVCRPRTVTIRGLDLDGKETIIEGSDLLARAFCHEIDHLNGVMFLEHLSFLKRDLIRRKIRKLVKQDDW